MSLLQTIQLSIKKVLVETLYKISQVELIRTKKKCKSQQYPGEAKVVVKQPQEEQPFVTSCLATSCRLENWLIDICCISDMIYNQGLLKKPHKTVISKLN